MCKWKSRYIEAEVMLEFYKKLKCLIAHYQCPMLSSNEGSVCNFEMVVLKPSSETEGKDGLNSVRGRGGLQKLEGGLHGFSKLS